MEREVSAAVWLGLALVGVSALLSIIWFTVVMGKEIQEGASGALVSINEDVSVGFIEDLAKGRIDPEMPTATAYKIFKTYEDVIIETACGSNGELTNVLTEGPCMGDDISGKVQLQLVKIDGGYVAFVHSADSTWASGTSTDPDQTGFNELKAKYGIVTGW